MSIRRAQDIFDGVSKKLLVYVVEGRDFVAKSTDGTSDPYVRLNFGKLPELRTAVSKKTINPKYEELFYYDQVTPDPLVVSVYSHHSLGSDEFMGQVALDRLDQLPPDEVVEQWYELSIRSDRKKKDKPVSGRLLLRLYFSEERETRPASPPENIYYYHDQLPNLKTGDLIAYNETGAIAAVMKICSNCRYSRFGMVLELPNRWTEKYELFVMEVTRNIDSLIDVFDDSTAEGVRIFRLRERLHHLHAQNVFWIPLKQNLNQESGQAMVEWLWNVHGGRQRFTEGATFTKAATSADPYPLRVFFKEWKPQVRMSVLDFYNSELIFKALKIAGRIPETTPSSLMNPQAIASLDCLAAPVLLRDRKFKRPSALPSSRALSVPDVSRSATILVPTNSFLTNSNPDIRPSGGSGNGSPRSSNSPVQNSPLQSAPPFVSAFSAANANTGNVNSPPPPQQQQPTSSQPQTTTYYYATQLSPAYAFLNSDSSSPASSSTPSASSSPANTPMSHNTPAPPLQRANTNPTVLPSAHVANAGYVYTPPPIFAPAFASPSFDAPSSNAPQRTSSGASAPINVATNAANTPSNSSTSPVKPSAYTTPPPNQPPPSYSAVQHARSQSHIVQSANTNANNANPNVNITNNRSGPVYQPPPAYTFAPPYVAPSSISATNSAPPASSANVPPPNVPPPPYQPPQPKPSAASSAAAQQQMQMQRALAQQAMQHRARTATEIEPK